MKSLKKLLLAAALLPLLLTASTGFAQIRGENTPGTGNYEVTGSTTNAIWTTTEGHKATYTATGIGIVPAASATDVCYLTGVSNKTLKVIRASFSGTQTTSSTVGVRLMKRTGNNSGGTCAGVTVTQHDSSDPAPAAVVNSCTANPTLGSPFSTIQATNILIPAPASTTVAQDAVWTFDNGLNAKPLVIRGLLQVAAINLLSTTITGGSVTCSFTWTEE